jgi:predicted nuclease of predicted toxin-antitoxin system
LAQWLSSEFGVEAKPVRDLSLRDAKDREIFLAAREAEAVVLTKDSDFVLLLEQLGSPPQIQWLTVGNTSNAYLKEVLSRS